MIKVIVEFKQKKGADLQPILLKLRYNAMQCPGFINAENLQSIKDSSILTIIQTWEKPEAWWAWGTSKTRQDILREAEGILIEPPKVTLYNVIPTVSWVG